jgi:hypothetical protein
LSCKQFEGPPRARRWRTGGEKPSTSLPAEVRAFVARHIAALEDVEALLLLFGTRQRWWTVRDVATHLRVPLPLAAAALERLSGRFLEVRMTGDLCYRFGAAHPERERLTATLAMVYEAHRTEIARLVAAGRSAWDFADAFRLKGED